MVEIDNIVSGRKLTLVSLSLGQPGGTTGVGPGGVGTGTGAGVGGVVLNWKNGDLGFE